MTVALDAAPWSGSVFLGSGWLVYHGPLGATAPHAHHAAQAIVAAAPTVVVGDFGSPIISQTVVVPADHRHALDGGGVIAAVAYLDPINLMGAGNQISVRQELPSLEALEDLEEARVWADRVADVLGRRPASGPGEVVASALLAMRGRLPGRVRLADVAEAIGCSSSTLSHRFSDEIGIPMRRWVLWERLQAAAREVAAGRNLTVAAHAAGFADSAHLNRTFRQMFGLTPTEAIGLVRWSVEATPVRSSA